jgi:hypothetical protein
VNKANCAGWQDETHCRGSFPDGSGAISSSALESRHFHDGPRHAVKLNASPQPEILA